jgi:TnpA family transposase
VDCDEGAFHRIARYLRDRDLQREINARLNVVENYNGVNDYIFFGKSGELSTNRREEQEISMICLQILQSCLGYVFSELWYCGGDERHFLPVCG